MDLSPDQKKLVQYKFLRYCRKTLKGEAGHYLQELKDKSARETLFSELRQREWNRLYCLDDYRLEYECFPILGIEVEVRNQQIIDALKHLPEKKQKVILMAFFLDMTEMEIAEEMNLVQSTIHYHKQASLKILKKWMEKEK